MRFRQPVEVGVEVVLSGRVVADRGRLVDAAGQIRRAIDGELLAEGTSRFVRVPESRTQQWEARYLAAPDE